MKINKIPSVFALALGLVTISVGCSKQEPATPPTTQTAPPPNTALDTAQKEAENKAAELKAKADSLVTEVTRTADAVKPPEPIAPPALPVTPPASPSPAQGILQRVQALVAEQKYPEALSALSELSNVSLTTEQQSLITRLKTEISTAMAAKAGNDGLKSVGGLLKK